MGMDTVQFAILIQCAECGASTPINGMTTSVPCAYCSQPFPLSEEHWLRLLGDFVRSDLRIPRGESDVTEVTAPWGEFSVEHGHCAPVCPECNRDLPEALWRAPAGPFSCPACKREVSVRPAPDWYTQGMPAARWLVGETFSAEAGIERAEGPVTVHCVNCGASLDADGAARTLACAQCGSDIILPDRIWSKFHPNAPRKRWTMLLDTGATGYVLPEDIEDFCDVAHAPDRGLIAAFIEEQDYDEDEEDDGDASDDPERPNPARIVKFDRQGLVAWLRDDIRFDSYAELLCTPDGSQLALVLSEGAGLIWLDPETGQTLGRIDCPDTEDEAPEQPPERLRPLRLKNAAGLALAPDGSLVVLRQGPADVDPLFTRYTRDGQAIPMWPPAPEPEPTPAPVQEPPAKGGFFSRLFGKHEQEAPPPPPKPAVFAEWDALPDRVLLPPLRVDFTFSPAGDLILVCTDREHLAHYDREGKLVETHPITGLPEAASWGGIGVDEFECVYLAYMPPEYWMSGGGMHLIRLPLGGRPEIFRGYKVDPTCPLGDSEARLKVRSDGTLYLGSHCRNLRVISPEGQILFRSPATVELDDVDRQRYQEHS